MKHKRWLLLGTLLAGFCLPLGAQVGSVAGKVKDEHGHPIAGVSIEFLNLENGRKFGGMKTDKNGEYFSLGIGPGKYKVTFTAKEGTTLFVFNNYPINLGENTVDLDLAKERALAGGGKEVTPEQKQQMAEEQKKVEERQKESVNIKSLNEKLAAAKAAEDAQNWDQAVAIMTEATTMDPTRHELWANLCVAEFGGKKFDDAGEHCQKAIALAQQLPSPDPFKLAQYHNELGQVYAKSGKSQEAMAEYTSAAQADPASAAKYYFNLGAILTNESARQQDQDARFRMIDRATEAFDKAIIADPNYAEAYYQKAVNLLGKATLDKSNKMVAPPGTAEAFNKYLELEPTGRHAEEVKGMLAYIGAEVQTSYGKQRTKK